MMILPADAAAFVVFVTAADDGNAFTVPISVAISTDTPNEAIVDDTNKSFGISSSIFISITLSFDLELELELGLELELELELGRKQESVMALAPIGNLFVVDVDNNCVEEEESVIEDEEAVEEEDDEGIVVEEIMVGMTTRPFLFELNAELI